LNILPLTSYGARGVISIILWFNTSLLAQTDIRLVPAFGMQAFQSYAKDDVSAEGFSGYNLNMVPAYQVGLEADVKRTWLFSMSVKSYRPTIAFKYGDKVGGIMGYLGVNCTSLAVGVERKISTHSWIKIKPAKSKRTQNSPSVSGNAPQRYLLLFRLKALGGISRDWVANYPGNEDLGNTNTSVFLGLAFQFFDRDKDKFKLSLIYSQGFREIAIWDVDYSLYGVDYSGQIASKGSFFAVQLSYPLRLFTVLARK
jgi:hypothetical protein